MLGRHSKGSALMCSLRQKKMRFWRRKAEIKGGNNYTTGSVINKRFFFVGAAFAVAFGILIVKAISFRLADGRKLENIANRQYKTAVRTAVRRGEIVDAKGRQMAVSIAMDSLYADPMLIADPTALAAKLAPIIKMNESELRKKLSSRRRFVWLKRWVDPAEVAAVMDLKEKGVNKLLEHKRSYPQGALGAAVLGAVGFDGQPLGGVESRYDDVLTIKGESDATYKRDARGRVYVKPSVDVDYKEPQKITLTLDEMIQFIAEKHLKQVVLDVGAKSGTAVVLDPQTGAVLAMAVYPSFDPNNFGEYALDRWRNRAITDAYEPGSTFKAFVIAKALDLGFVRADDEFFCENGKWAIQDAVITDTSPRGTLSVADIIKLSSNIGAAKIGQKLGKQMLYSLAKDFGFGERTGIDLPGESTGILPEPENWYGMRKITFAFGYGVSATPLQTATALAAIANGGYLVKPYVVASVEGNAGKTITTVEKKRRVISVASAKRMTELLRRVVEGGTGKRAMSDEYEAAGKTGTAHKARLHGKGYAEGKYFASFAGFAPLKSPRVVVFVGIDEPQEKYYGGEIAAPTFKSIVDDVLHYMSVPADKLMTAEEDDSGGDDDDSGTTLLAKKAQKPLPIGSGKWSIPDFTGLTVREVLDCVGTAPIELSFEGSGIVTGQEPVAGSIIDSQEGLKLVLSGRNR